MKQFIQDIRVLDVEQLKIVNEYIDTLTFKANTNHPGFLTLIPTAGTALLILFMNGKTYLHKIFSQFQILKKYDQNTY